VVVGFQAGEGPRDVSVAYRRFGHEIELERHCYTADEVALRLESAGLQEVCRMVRRARGTERDDQAVLIARAEQLASGPPRGRHSGTFRTPGIDG
jgi:hypothetical protein